MTEAQAEELLAVARKMCNSLKELPTGCDACKLQDYGECRFTKLKRELDEFAQFVDWVSEERLTETSDVHVIWDDSEGISVFLDSMNNSTGYTTVFYAENDLTEETWEYAKKIGEHLKEVFHLKRCIIDRSLHEEGRAE